MRKKASSRRKAATPKRKQTRRKANGAATRWVGKSVQRKEEARLVRGEGMFVGDYKLQGMLYLHLVRSPYAHAKIERIDVSEAEKHPGVVCTLTGPEVAGLVQPFMEIGPDPGAKIIDYPMATDRVRYQGEPTMLYVHMVRSPYAHAKIERIDVTEAENHPGVVCTLTGTEIAGLVQPFMEIGPDPGAKIIDYPMATDRVRPAPPMHTQRLSGLMSPKRRIIRAWSAP